MGQNTSTAVLEAVNTMTGGAFPMKDPLDAAGSCVFDDKVMAEKLPAAILKRFQGCLISGDPTTEEDQKIIADTLYEWARERGAIDFAHWFFPLRGGGGAVGGMLGAFKQDTLLDLDFASKYVTKPMKACLPAERLFQGETDGSSFPNGGLRVTHSAAAFTTWDRTSAPFVLNKTLYIPCAFVTHFGKCIDEKTPLLRSMDAVKVQGLRLLKAVGLGKDANTMHSYLGWEQEFFVIDAEHYKARPDLVNTGRSLFGKLPTRHQQGDLNYFQPIPTSVATLLDRVQALMLEVGCPMAVKHNEVAPGQHEMSPVFRTANVSCDTNVLFMEVMNREAQKLGLQVLFHEKPFAGINGSGKHANWSVGTDTGLNFFYPGKTEEGAKLFVTGIACLSYGLAQYNELVRCTVATAGNDHRLGAQEAPPAIISQKFVRTNQFTTPSLNSSQSKTFHRNLWMSQVHVPCTVPSVQSPWQDQSLQIKNDLDRGAVSIEMRAILASLCILQIAALEYTPEALKDEIHDLPGLPADVNFKMFSGYIDLTPLGQRPKSKEIFYWFVEAQKDPDNAPLVFWTNGGPGCSGLAGFLTEMGPFKVGFDGKNLVHNPYAWNKIANMIFVEQPAGVGFSPAGENPKYSDENSANDNRHFIMKFYDRYPALKTHDFYLSSESYGGHYLPTLGKVLVEQGGVPSFKGIMVGNPLTYMPYRDHGFYGTCWGHQLLPKPLWDAYVEHDCAKLKNPSAQTPDECWSVTNAMHRILSGLDPYALDFPTCVGGGAATGQHERLAILKTIARATKQPEQKYQPCSEDLTTHYLNLKEVKAAIHARDFTWQLCSGEVNYLYNPHDTHAPMMPLWKFLIEHASLNLMIFSGDDDSICATLGSQQFIWDLGYETDEAKNWAPWKVDDEIAGYWTEFKVPAGGKFAFVTVHGAGHMVPSTQPKSGLAIFEKFLKRTVGKTTLATM